MNDETSPQGQAGVQGEPQTRDEPQWIIDQAEICRCPMCQEILKRHRERQKNKRQISHDE